MRNLWPILSYCYRLSGTYCTLRDHALELTYDKPGANIVANNYIMMTVLTIWADNKKSLIILSSINPDILYDLQ